MKRYFIARQQWVKGYFPYQSQLHTLTITPYAKDGDPLMGCLVICRFYEQGHFWVPQATVDCDAEASIDDPEGDTTPSYEIRLPPGHYRITANDELKHLFSSQELIITPKSPRCIELAISEDAYNGYT